MDGLQSRCLSASLPDPQLLGAALPAKVLSPPLPSDDHMRGEHLAATWYTPRRVTILCWQRRKRAAWVRIKGGHIHRHRQCAAYDGGHQHLLSINHHCHRTPHPDPSQETFASTTLDSASLDLLLLAWMLLLLEVCLHNCTTLFLPFSPVSFLFLFVYKYWPLMSVLIATHKLCFSFFIFHLFFKKKFPLSFLYEQIS